MSAFTRTWLNPQTEHNAARGSVSAAGSSFLKSFLIQLMQLV